MKKNVLLHAWKGKRKLTIHVKEKLTKHLYTNLNIGQNVNLSISSKIMWLLLQSKNKNIEKILSPDFV